jgi:hydrolase, NUDIX family
MSKSKLLNLNENNISPYLSHYHSEYSINGAIKKYDFVSRKKSLTPEKLSQPYKSDAVSIFVQNEDKSKLLLIKEFRYAVNNYVISTPAGLIENNEDITSAAIRELYEEIGYTEDQIIVNRVLLPSYSAVGLSDEQVASVFVAVDDSIKPKQHLESSEDIEYFWIDAHDAEYFLENGYFKEPIMSSIGLKPNEPIGVTARTQFMLKQFADTLPSKEFRAFIDSI